MNPVHCTVYNEPCTLYSVQCTGFIIQGNNLNYYYENILTLYIYIYSTYTVHSVYTVYVVYYTLMYHV